MKEPKGNGPIFHQKSRWWSGVIFRKISQTSFRIDDDDDDDDDDAVFKGCGEKSRVEGYLSEKRSHPAPILPLLVVVNQMIWVVTLPSSSHHQDFYIFY